MIKVEQPRQTQEKSFLCLDNLNSFCFQFKIGCLGFICVSIDDETFCFDDKFLSTCSGMFLLSKARRRWKFERLLIAGNVRPQLFRKLHVCGEYKSFSGGIGIEAQCHPSHAPLEL